MRPPRRSLGRPPHWPRLGHRLSLRGRLALLTTGAVAIGIGVGVVVAYVAIGGQLERQLNQRLTQQAAFIQRNAPEAAHPNAAKRVFRRPEDAFGQPAAYLQLVHSDGTTKLPVGQIKPLPVTPTATRVATGSLGSSFTDITLAGVHVRVYTAQLDTSTALEVALPLTDVDHELSVLRLELLFASLAGVALAAGLGWLVTRAALRPIGTLTEAAERVAATRDLAHRIETDRPDEIGRLAMSINAMLAAVRQATDARRQLVADASHELRTPLTALRLNAEVLARGDELDAAERVELIQRIMAGADDMTTLVTDIVELARGEEPAALAEELRWDLVVERAVERARRHWPATTFTLVREPVLVRGVADRLARALANLLDNAAKYAGTGSADGAGSVDVALTCDGVLSVRDHGPGIAETDLPHVFDRFYRAPRARRIPGSGLGLAIVRQVAESHGGTVSAGNAPDGGGGAVFTMWLPVARVGDDDVDDVDETPRALPVTSSQGL
jgi:two-component system sensor histidine kinase MprB